MQQRAASRGCRATAIVGFGLATLVLAPGCGGADDDRGAAAHAAGGSASTAPRAADPATAPPSYDRPAGAADPQAPVVVADVGVPECDDYVRTYAACIGTMPVDSRFAATKALEASRIAWKAVAAKPDGAAVLTDMCKRAAQTVKSACGEIGVPACDAYLQRYAACIERLPADDQPAARQGLDASRAAWKAAAAIPQRRAELPALCEQATEAIEPACGS